MNAEDDGKIVVRFTPFAHDKLEVNAQGTWDEDIKDGTEPPRYGVSVYAIQPHTGESKEQAAGRVCRSLALRGPKVAVVSGREVRLAGFHLVEAEPPADHHLIGADNMTLRGSFGGLAALFSNNVYKRATLIEGIES